MKRRRFLSLMAASFSTPSFASAPHEWRGFGLGAEVSLKVHGTQEQARAAIEAVKEILKRAEDTFSLYNNASEVSRLNSGERLTPSRDMQEMLETCAILHDRTDGYFNPTVQNSWIARANGTGVKHKPNSWPVQVNDTLFLNGDALTFNGVAQGWATETAKIALHHIGLTHVLINLGEFSALGGPWNIGIANDVGDLIGTRHLINRAIATTSVNAMLAEHGGHIINPKDSKPPLHATVSVIHENAAYADGLSTGSVFLDHAQLAQMIT